MKVGESQTVKLSAVESVRLTREATTVRLELLVGSCSLVQRHILPAAARNLGDALGFLSNDMERGA